jgi:hypothetical protein
VEGDLADGIRARIDDHGAVGEASGDRCVIGRPDLVEGQADELVSYTGASGKFERAHVSGDGRDGDPSSDGLQRGEREVLGVVMPRRASATGFLRQSVVVVEPDSRFIEQSCGKITQTRGQRDFAHHLVVQPHLLEGDEATRHIFPVLGLQEAVKAFSQSADDRRREHVRKFDEGVTTERISLGVFQVVGGCELDPQLLIVGGLHVGEAGTGHQRTMRVRVLGKRDVPVPPVLVVACPGLLDTAVTVGGRKQRVLRIHIQSSAASWRKA